MAAVINLGPPTDEDCQDLYSARDQWAREGLCRGADLTHFYQSRQVEQLEVAHKYCWSCPVRVECLEWAIRMNEQYGVWGGLTERERGKLMTALRRRIRLHPEDNLLDPLQFRLLVEESIVDAEPRETQYRETGPPRPGRPPRQRAS